MCLGCSVNVIVIHSHSVRTCVLMHNKSFVTVRSGHFIVVYLDLNVWSIDLGQQNPTPL